MFVLNSAYCRIPPLIKVFLLKTHVLFVDLTVAGKALMNYVKKQLLVGVSRDQQLLVRRTRDWLIGDDITGRVLYVILNRQLHSILTVYKTPLPTTRPGLQGRDWNHTRPEF